MDKDPARIIVVGGSGAIGRALVDQLLLCFPLTMVHATYFLSAVPQDHERLQWHQLDARDPEQIMSFAKDFDHIDWVINCAGYLHGEHGGPEKTIKTFDADFLMENIKVNTLPTLLLAKNFAAALKKSKMPRLATVSARVGSIDDNRLGGWYSYRISKAALNMALKTLSLEWKHSHPQGSVAALHPGTNDSPLSKPFQVNVAPENLFDPAYTASCFVNLLTRLDPDNSGKFWAWDGTAIPW